MPCARVEQRCLVWGNVGRMVCCAQGHVHGTGCYLGHDTHQVPRFGFVGKQGQFVSVHELVGIGVHDDGQHSVGYVKDCVGSYDSRQ